MTDVPNHSDRSGASALPVQSLRADRRDGERGQALVEMGIVVLLLFTLTMGVLELGRAWLILSAITNAARAGARSAALTPATGRSPLTHLITGATQSSVGTAVKTQILNATGVTLPLPTVNPQADVNGVPMVAVTVTGTVPYLFQIPPFNTPMSLSKTVAFRDEGR
jgi:Flp pilus assembly protein TadG